MLPITFIHLCQYSFVKGIRLEPNDATVNATLFPHLVFLSLIYNFDDQDMASDFEPRAICIIAYYDAYNTTGCVDVLYIGKNDAEPKLEYTSGTV